MDFKRFLRDFIKEHLVSKDFIAFLIIIDLLSGVDTAMEIEKSHFECCRTSSKVHTLHLESSLQTIANQCYFHFYIALQFIGQRTNQDIGYWRSNRPGPVGF